MSVDALLVFLSLIGFAVLIVSWIGAPLHAETVEPSPSAAAEPVQNTVAA